jgi:PPOX class probable F420-dependent enzyme
VGVSLSDNEVWEMLEQHRTGVLTTLRSDGWPVSVPVWFVADRRRIYVWAPPRTAKVRRVARDPRVCFCVEGGLSWDEVRAVVMTGHAVLVDDRTVRSEVAALFAQKYEGYRMPSDRLPQATRRHYAGRPALVEITPDDGITSWDNARVRLLGAPAPGPDARASPRKEG